MNDQISGTEAGIMLACSLYSQRELRPDWVRQLSGIAAALEERLGLSFTEVGCALGEDWLDTRLPYKSYRMIKRNRVKIESLLDRGDILRLSYERVDRDAVQYRDIQLGLEFGRGLSTRKRDVFYHDLQFLVCLDDVAINTGLSNPQQFFVWLLSQVQEFMQIDYGLIHPMPVAKLPGLYFGGIHNDELDAYEKRNLDIWIGSRHEFPTKIWDVFWGNVITDEHLKPYPRHMLGALEECLDHGSVTEWAPGKYFVQLSDFPIRVIDQPEDFIQTRQAIRSLFASHGRVMDTDDGTTKLTVVPE